MVDARFFKNSGPFSLEELAARIGGRLADAAPRNLQITDIATLEDATGSELAMFSDARYRDGFQQTKAGAVLTTPEFAGAPPPSGGHLIFAESPRLAYAEAAWLFYPAAAEAFASDDGAVAAHTAFGDDCRISPSAIIGTHAVIGARSRIGAHAVIGQGVVVGDDCVIGPNTTVSHTIMGNRVQIYPGAAVGVQGFGFVPSPRGLRRVPQLGRVMIEDDVEIGANSTIDRGAIGDTVIGRGSVIDNLVHIAHNVRVGRFCIFAAQSGVAGSTVFGDGVMIGGHAAIKDHLVIGSSAQIAGASGVIRDVEKGEKVAGYPAIPAREWHRQTVGLRKMFNRSH